MTIEAELPDGRILEFPDGTKPDVIQAAAKRLMASQSPAQTAKEKPGIGAAALAGVNRGIAGIAGLPVDTVENVVNLAKAGFGTAATAMGKPDLAPNITRGAFGGSESISAGLNKIGIGTENPNPQDAASRMAYTAGMIGGSSVVPGAKVLPTAASAASGAIAGEVLGPQWAAPASMVPAAARAVMGAPKAPTNEQATKEAREAGFVLPPGQSNPTLWNKMLEGFAGKLTTAQLSSQKNQEKVNVLARRSLGLADDAQITPQMLANMRAQAGDAYQAIKDFGSGRIKFRPDSAFKAEIDSIGGDFAKAAKEFPDLLSNAGVDALKTALVSKPISPAAAVELSKKLRQEASTNLKAFDNNEKLALGRAQRDAANAIEGLVERNLSATGNGQLVQDFRTARTTIARSHDIESALNSSTGDISAKAIAKLSDKGRPLGSELQTVANAAEAFPKAFQDPAKIGSVNTFSPLDYLAGIGGAAVSPYLAAAAVARPVVRESILSRPYQSMFATPSAAPYVPEGQLPSWVRASVMSNQR